jgi:hypothetical protein
MGEKLLLAIHPTRDSYLEYILKKPQKLNNKRTNNPINKLGKWAVTKRSSPNGQ